MRILGRGNGVTQRLIMRIALIITPVVDTRGDAHITETDSAMGYTGR